MIKVSLLILSLFSLMYGLFFLIFPFYFAVFTDAETTNIAWLRNIGASITGMLFIGLFIIYLEPSKTIKLLRIIIITSIIQTSALIFSRFNNEFSAKNIFIIDLTIILALFVTIYLLIISIKFKKDFI